MGRFSDQVRKRLSGNSREPSKDVEFSCGNCLNIFTFVYTDIYLKASGDIEFVPEPACPRCGATEELVFSHKDYKNLDYHGKPIVKELTLHYTKFFPRLLQHVPLPYFRLVRYYGVYAARSKAILKSCYKDHLSESMVDQGEEKCDEPAETPKHCKTCNVAKTYLYTTFLNRNKELVYMSRFNPAATKLKAMAA